MGRTIECEAEVGGDGMREERAPPARVGRAGGRIAWERGARGRGMRTWWATCREVLFDPVADVPRVSPDG
jgi:hypothetical protein